MELKNFEKDEIEQINFMLDFLLARAEGKVPTGAKFIRDFISKCPTYEHDSKLS